MTQDIRTQQAEQDILNLLVSPDQTRLRYAPDGTSGESAGQFGWQVEAVEVPMATVSYPLNPADRQPGLASRIVI
jgi:hypothetical protein